MLFNDVEVVEQPFARRTDVNTIMRRPGKSLVGIGQDDARGVEAVEEPRTVPAAPSSLGALSLGERTRSLREVIGAKQLAANGPCVEILACLRRSAQLAKEAGDWMCGKGHRCEK
jgi:hypothetical protein